MRFSKNRGKSPSAQRAMERRQREDEAARLKDEVPNLVSLRVEFEEVQNGGTVTGVKHVRPFVVEHAPALFEIHCGDAHCDSCHDLTRAVMAALRGAESEFRGEDSCSGMIGSAACRRTLRYTGIATYRQAQPRDARRS